MQTEKSRFQSLAEFSAALVGVVEETAQVTVLVNARKRLPVSGLIIGAGQVLTVDHGIEKEEGIQIYTADAKILSASIVGRDPGTDLALLALVGEYNGYRELASGEARVGMPVIMVGRPETEGHQASFGMVTATGKNLRTVRGSILEQYITSDATPYPGFSGGPLTAISGEILGLNTSGLVGGVSLAVPLGLALTVGSQLAQFGRVKRGFLGVRSQKAELSEKIREQVQGSRQTGLLIVGLEPNGPAEAAGVLVGDILVRCGDSYLCDPEDLTAFLTVHADQILPFTIVRGGEVKTIDINIGLR